MSASDTFLDEIAACLNRNLARYQFAPRWTAADLRSGRTRGLSSQDFVVAIRGSRVVGCLARWNQSAFKQVVVRGYAPALAWPRPLVNVFGSWFGVPPLPRAGGALRFAYLSHAAVDDDREDVFEALVREQCRRARADGLDYVATAFVPRHPFHDAVVRGFRHRAYDSLLHVAFWPDGESAARRPDRRIPQPEVAVL